MILRPYGVVLDGRLELGLELVLHDGKILEVRPHTGIPEDFIVSPAFVNAHSHLEYRGLMGAISEDSYWPWIREITRLKALQNPESVSHDCQVAARENRLAGVAWIGEHSDRPFAARALEDEGIGGMVFQELITFLEQDSPAAKIAATKARAVAQATEFSGDVFLSPHAPYTVDAETLVRFKDGQPFSIHVAETESENEFFQTGNGVIGEFFRHNGFSPAVCGLTSVGFLSVHGLVRTGAQFVHCCAVSEDDLQTMSAHGVTVAHCPRSNKALGCPPAPVREMLDSGIDVGLGLDSAASSGPIDMFEEMREAIVASRDRYAPISAEECWLMATNMGARSLWKSGWAIAKDSTTPLIKIHFSSAHTTQDLIEKAKPSEIEWVR